MKKYIAEAIGTCVLTTVGCGTAMLVGYDAAVGSGYLLTALAFGLSIVAIFSLGGVVDMTGGLGSNGLAGVNGSAIAGLLVEVLLTFIFVTAIVGPLVGAALAALVYKFLESGTPEA